MADSITRYGSRRPPRPCTEAIATESGIANWVGQADLREIRSGVVLEFNPGPEHGVLRAKVIAAIQDRRVEWEFVSSIPEPARVRLDRNAVSFRDHAARGPAMGRRARRTAIVDFGTATGTREASISASATSPGAEALQKLKQWCESRAA